MVSIGTKRQARRTVKWLSCDTDDIFVSTRVRLARNLAGSAFPQWATEEVRTAVRDEVVSALTGVEAMRGGMLIRMDELSELDRDILKEEHLVSREFASGVPGCALSISRNGEVSVMVNEEDHIRMQYIGAGCTVREGWAILEAVDAELDRRLKFAFSAKYGYLTACPTNVGTGLRASVMMHLPGLQLMGEIEQVIKGLSVTGLQVRGLLGEGSEAYGNMYQVSNKETLGLKEGDILDMVNRLALEVAVHEQNARERLLQKKQAFVADRVARAVGILQSCRMISSGEALGYLSGLRLGLECGMISGLDGNSLSELILLIQPAHLQQLHGSPVLDERRDELRAGVLRERLGRVKFTG